MRKEAALALSQAGQEPDFFLEKHVCGDCGHANYENYEKGVREGSLIYSKYRTLRNHEIILMTFPAKQETHLVCPMSCGLSYSQPDHPVENGLTWSLSDIPCLEKPSQEE